MNDARQGTRRGDQLIDQILLEHVEFGEPAVELLREFWNGFPITELSRLLTAKGNAQVYTGVSLASELGEQGRPIFDSVVPLLWHTYEKVRFYAVDFMTATVQPTDRQVTATVITLIDDPASSVRYAVMKFLLDVPREVLEAVVVAPLDSRMDDDPHRAGLALLMDAVEGRNSNQIRNGLDGSLPVVRRFAAAAAARLLPFDRMPLERAVNSDDPDLVDFAQRMLVRIQPRSSRQARPN